MPQRVADAAQPPPPSQREVALPGRRVVLPPVDPSAWADEFAAFATAGGRWSAQQFSRWRIDQAAALLALPEVARAPAAQRVRFLRTKGLNDDEIGEALQAAGDVRGELCLAEQGAALGGDSDSEDAVPAQAHAPDDPRALWRVGAMVYAYAGNFSYYHVPLVGTDFDRHEDILSVSFMDADGTWGAPTWFAPGLKGVVADVFPAASDVLSGTDVICAWEGADKGHFKEGVVLAPPAADGMADVEFALGGTVSSRKVALGDLRTVLHPRLLALQRDSDAARKSAKPEPARAGATFPYPGRAHERGGAEGGAEGAQSPPASALVSEERAQLMRGNMRDEELYEFSGPLRSLNRYPPLDVDTQPSFLSTFADFVREYGNTRPGQPGEGAMPVHPPSQRDLTGQGFGFDFSRHERHPRNRELFVCNPLIDACGQCYLRDTCFVDPDFPPSLHSLYGSESGGDGSGRSAFEWRRLTELCYRPRVTAPASDRWGLRPGAFRNGWLAHVISAVRGVSEWDSIISPSDGSLHPFGCYAVRLYIDGGWYFVLVDDFVPVHRDGGVPACILNASEGEWYAAILEKALAKLHGSYLALHSSQGPIGPERTWEDLTGGVGDCAIHALLTCPSAFVDNMLARQEERRFCSMLATARSEGTAQRRLSRAVTEKDFQRLGMDAGGCSFVIDVAAVTDQLTGQRYDAVLAANPYPAAAREEDHPVHGDVLLQKAGLPAQVIRTLQDRPHPENAARRKGALWFPFSEYMRFHERLITLWHFDGLHRAALCGSFEGKAGGSLFQSEETFFGNPQFALSLVLDRYTSMSSAAFVAAQLSLADRRFGALKGTKPDAVRLQLHILNAPAERDEPLPPGSRDSHLFASNLIDLLDDDSAIDHPSVHFTAQLKPGRYILIPDVGSTTSCEQFALKVWSNANFQLRLVN
eukprot:TRINITY_DN65103_c0_g1_i1.p1 TRINITY_DN65103_c0_g1~~TRINITY_DN65103_c0_g1_i1.p1  ORF type:complete len:948 (+),score=359.20 TRINITY_DN65103_c0_g1_i1:67-2844(+)